MRVAFLYWLMAERVQYTAACAADACTPHGHSLVQPRNSYACSSPTSDRSWFAVRSWFVSRPATCMVTSQQAWQLQYTHVAAHDLGRVFAAETGFILSRQPDTVRAPDVAFISRARLPSPPPRGFAEMAPDLAVEVLSPEDPLPEVLEKVADWLRAGTRLVWVVDPVRLLARVYRADGSESLLGENEALNGEDVLPTFSYDLRSLLRSERT